MGAELGKAYVQIIPSAQGIKGKLEGAISGDASAAGESAGNLISGRIKKVLAGAAIGAVITKGIKSSLSEGANLEQAIGGIETLYGKSADRMIKYADQAYKTAGISANKYMEQSTSFAASLLQATGGNTQKAAETANQAIIDMSDNANKMGTSIESIQDAYQGFARGQYQLLDNLRLGYGGTKGEMERLLADAEKISGQHYDINNLDDVYNAIHVIQGQLGITGTTAKEAATTFSGSFASMQSAASNLMGDLMLGRNIGPAMQGLAESASTFFFNNFIPALGNIFQSLPTAISTFITSGLPGFIQSGQQLMNSIATGFTTAVSSFAASLPARMSVMIPGIMNGLVSLSGAIRSGAGQMITAGLELIKGLATGLANNLPTFIATVPTIISNIAGIINDNVPKILATGVQIIVTLGAGLIKAIPSLIANMPKIIKAIVDAFTAFSWGSLGKAAIKGIGNGIKAAGSSLKEFITKPFSQMKSAIVTKIGQIKSSAGKTFSGIKDKLLQPIQKAKDKILQIIDKIKGKFPFNIGKIINLKMPSISLKTASKSVFGKSITYPTGFSVNWHAKAMDQPYMFTDATLFGAGEAGDEFMYGRSNLMRDIREAVGGGGSTFNNTFNIYDANDPQEVADTIVRTLGMQLRTV